MRKKLEEEYVDYLTHLENLLKSNKGGDGFLVGDEVCSKKIKTHFTKYMPIHKAMCACSYYMPLPFHKNFLFEFQLTVADLSVAVLLHFPVNMGVDIKLDNFPKVKAHQERVESLPRIAQWIASRPQNDL